MCLIEGDASDGAANGGGANGTHRELAQSETHEKRGGRRISCRFPTYGDSALPVPSGVNYPQNGSQHRRMQDRVTVEEIYRVPVSG